ncbi:MAG TPA: type II secretion system protein [Burkholderiales bacterium]
MFIVIVSVSITGIFLVLNKATRTSADPVARKQALAIAESLLEEIELMPFTFCDPTDANAATATGAFVGAGGCATLAESGIGPEAGETRYSAATPYNDVNDYHGFTMNSGNGGIKDITNTVFPALNSYSASVSVVQEALGSIAATESLRVTVTVTGPGNTTVTLDGYRTRYAPNATQ